MTDSKLQVPLREKIIFGLGDFFGGGAGTMMSFVYFFFLTEVMHISSGIAGTIVLIVRIWDAVIDPTLGIYSDNTRTKWGRRRPWILAGAFLIVAAMAFLFMPAAKWGESARVVFFTFAWMFYCTVSSMVGLNYSALSSEISNDYKELNAVNSIRLTVSQISNLICAVTPLLVRDALIPRIGEQNAYFAMGITFGVIFGVIVLMVALFTKERVPPPAEKSKFDVRTFVKPLKIKCFRQMLLMYLFTFLSMDIVLMLFQHFMKYVAGRPGETSFVLGALIIAQICAIPVVYYFTKKVSKPLIFKCSVPFWVAGALALSMYNSSWPPALIYVFAAINGLGVCGCIMIPWLMFPDAVDAGELELGNRITGSFSGIMSFSRQSSTAIGMAIVGWIMEWTGYNSLLDVQPASAITGFRALIIVSSALLLGLSFFFASRIKLNGEKSILIKKALVYLRKGESLPAEIAQDLETIKKGII